MGRAYRIVGEQRAILPTQHTAPTHDDLFEHPCAY